MFLLSIIPIALNPDQPNQPGNKIDDIESNIKNLETLLTAEDFGWGSIYDFDQSTSKLDKLDSKYYIKDDSGNEKIDVTLVLKDLEAARKEDFELRKDLGLTSLDNPSERLLEIENKLSIGQQRFNDLTNHFNALLKGEIHYDANPLTPGIQQVSGLDTLQNPNGSRDANVVQQEIMKVVAYEKDLLSAKNFWEKVVNSHIATSSKEIKNVTRDDMFYTNTKDGIFGIKRLEELNDLMQKSINEEYKGVYGYSEKTYFLGLEIAKVQEDLEIKLNTSKHEKWFPEFKKELQSWQTNLLKLKQATTNEIKELENKLNRNPSNPNSTEDLNALQALYKKKASVGKINDQIKFIYKITGNGQAVQNLPSEFENNAKEEMNHLLKTKETTQKELIQLQKEIKAISNNPKMKDKLNALTQDLYRRQALIHEMSQQITYLKKLTTKSLTSTAPLLYIKEELLEAQKAKDYILKETKKVEAQIKIWSNNPKMNDKVTQLRQRLRSLNSAIFQMDFRIKHLSETVNKYEPTKKPS